MYGKKGSTRYRVKGRERYRGRRYRDGLWRWHYRKQESWLDCVLSSLGLSYGGNGYVLAEAGVSLAAVLQRGVWVSGDKGKTY